jgi:hypothetical protein
MSVTLHSMDEIVQAKYLKAPTKYVSCLRGEYPVYNNNKYDSKPHNIFFSLFKSHCLRRGPKKAIFRIILNVMLLARNIGSANCLYVPEFVEITSIDVQCLCFPDGKWHRPDVLDSSYLFYIACLNYSSVWLNFYNHLLICFDRLCGQSSWLQIQSSRVRFPALPDFLISSGSETGSNMAPSICRVGTNFIDRKRSLSQHSSLCNRPWKPMGLWDVKDPTLSTQSAHS